MECRPVADRRDQRHPPELVKSSPPPQASAKVKLEFLDNLAAGPSTGHGAPVRMSSTARAPNQKAPIDPRFRCLLPSGGRHAVSPPPVAHPSREIVGGHAAACNAGTPSRREVDWHPLDLPIKVKVEDTASKAPAGIVCKPCQKEGKTVDKTQDGELAGMMSATEGQAREGCANKEKAPNPLSRPDPRLEASRTTVGRPSSGLEQEMQLQDLLASYHSMCGPSELARVYNFDLTALLAG